MREGGEIPEAFHKALKGSNLDPDQGRETGTDGAMRRLNQHPD